MDDGVKLKESSSLTGRTVAYLTDLIVRGEVSSGDYLPSEQELCRQLGIGRGTLREAVMVLESKGLAERRHGIGIRVVDKGSEAISDTLQVLLKRRRTSAKELLEVRRLYEVEAAALAAGRATPGDLQIIGEKLQAMQSEETSTERYVVADLEFHLAVARATRNSVLALMIETIRPLLHDAIVLATRAGKLRFELSHHYHEEIYRAIADREPNQAALAMMNHLRGTEEALLRSDDVGEPAAERR